MGFQWTELSPGTRVTQEKYQELVDKVKSVENSLLLGSVSPGTKWSWDTGIDPFAKIYVVGEDLYEIRNAVDNLDDNNYCRGHKVNHKTTFDSIKHSTYNPTHYATYKNDLHTGLDSSLHGYNSTHYAGMDTYDYGYKSSDDNR